ncbi:FtsX-like permease family protein [Rudanella paleaurantiibacter]|uniref:FtsX-like permease family protein n=1 Tax=Rudanella paleaurantiibacter TaxID=2614655 RepID=A0A7J5U5C0_9BACT|nr:ABC transporter permease [Rudanella paleaurantiibacter]KAB7732851.1 FtsX-like permease family protein [Rudanella paleaurantiibacter]
MLTNYLKIAWRNLVNNKAFSFINIVGLSAGLSCCMLICLYIYDELSYDTQHPDVEQLYQVGTAFINPDGERKTAATPYRLADAMQQEYPEVGSTTRLVGLFGDDKTLLRANPTGNAMNSKLAVFYESKGYLADSSFFSFFRYNFVEGDGSKALANPNSIVLSETIARNLFGGQPALNRTIHVESNTNGKGDYTVTGVFRSGTVPTHIDARFFLSYAGGGLSQYINGTTGMASNNMFFTYLKLKPGTDARKLEAKLPTFVEKYMRKDLAVAGLDKKQFLMAVRDIHLHTDLTHNVTPNGSLTYLYILGSIALFTLLIACINFMNLSTARSGKRAAEVGVRKVLGAGQTSLVRQFLSEALLLSLFAFVLAVGLVWLMTPVFERVSGKTLHFSVTQRLELLASFFGISLFTGLLAGSYPAFYLSSFKPIAVLKGGVGRVGGSLAAVSLRKSLVVVQFTLSVVLMIALVVISQQMRYLRSADLGFAKEQQLIIPLRSETAKAAYPALKQALIGTAQVKSVGASAYYPGIFNPEDAQFYGEGQTKSDAEVTKINRVDPDYLQTMEINLVAGRLFSAAFPGDTNNRIILNEKSVKEMGFASAQAAIGKQAISDWGQDGHRFTIVGVVKDFHFEDLHVPITPFGFMLNPRGNYNYAVINLKAGNTQTMLQTLESVWQRLNPAEPFEYSFLDADFQKNYEAENRLSTLVSYFTFIAILISCLGLFGLASFNVEQRVKEIGVRKVLGATVGSVMVLLSKDFLKLVLIAVVLASPLAWYAMDRWLQGFAYKITIEWWVFALAGALAVGIALFTVSFQSVKAALMNPVKSLRSE